MIAILDYGLGNAQAFANIYRELAIPHRIARTVDDLRHAARLILPGVGSFDHAMERLRGSGLMDALSDLVHVRRLPVLGVCVGMQILARSSDEGVADGLGWIGGTVKKIPTARTEPPTRLPHMGWNTLTGVGDHPLVAGLPSGSEFYFLHSYYFECDDPIHVLARVDYVGSYPCAVGRDNILGVQFHPEKSHRNGVRLLQNFSRI